MVTKDTMVITSTKGHRIIQEIRTGDVVKTIAGDRKVVKTDRKKDDGVKLIFSDGFKVIAGNSCEFLLYPNIWKKAQYLEEGDLVAKPDNTFAKIVDITPLTEINFYILSIEDNGCYVLSNGMAVR